MNPFGQPSNHSKPRSSAKETEFEQAFEEVEASLLNLKQRYLQVQTAKQRRTELQQRLNQLQAELRQIKESLETLEIDLESRLLSWRSQREVFWQIVRFVGLGIVVGLALKACTTG